MIGQLPPYALAPVRFRFKALVSQAGRTLLGGDREVLLACFVACRAGAGLCYGVPHTPAELALRAAAARTWLASLSIPGQVRLAVGAVIDASGTADGVAVARATAHLLMLAAPQLDEAAFAEMRELTDELAHDSSEFMVEPAMRR